MALRTYDAARLMNNLRIALPGALDGAIQLEVFNLFNEFFQETNLWQEKLEFTITPANAIGSKIPLTPNAGSINRLMWVFDANNVQRNMAMPIPGELLVLEAANGTEIWTATVANTCTDPVPTSGSLGGFPLCPGWILQKYNNGLMSGILARMMVQPAKPYTNPKLSMMHTSTYRKAVSEGRTEARRMNIYAGQTWRFPQGFGTRHDRDRGWG